MKMHSCVNFFSRLSTTNDGGGGGDDVYDDHGFHQSTINNRPIRIKLKMNSARMKMKKNSTQSFRFPSRFSRHQEDDHRGLEKEREREGKKKFFFNIFQNYIDHFFL